MSDRRMQTCQRVQLRKTGCCWRVIVAQDVRNAGRDLSQSRFLFCDLFFSVLIGQFLNLIGCWGVIIECSELAPPHVSYSVRATSATQCWMGAMQLGGHILVWGLHGAAVKNDCCSAVLFRTFSRKLRTKFFQACIRSLLSKLRLFTPGDVCWLLGWWGRDSRVPSIRVLPHCF